MQKRVIQKRVVSFPALGMVLSSVSIPAWHLWATVIDSGVIIWPKVSPKACDERNSLYHRGGSFLSCWTETRKHVAQMSLWPTLCEHQVVQIQDEADTDDGEKGGLCMSSGHCLPLGFQAPARMHFLIDQVWTGVSVTAAKAFQWLAKCP